MKIKIGMFLFVVVTSCVCIYAGIEIGGKGPSLEVITLDLIDYVPEFSPKVSREIEENEIKVLNNIREGVISFKEWYVEEDEENWYFISRKMYKPENNNTLVQMRDYISFSDLDCGRYTEKLNFNTKNDPLLEKGHQYLFGDIKMGKMYTVSKGDPNHVSSDMYFGNFDVVQ